MVRVVVPVLALCDSAWLCESVLKWKSEVNISLGYQTALVATFPQPNGWSFIPLVKRRLSTFSSNDMANLEQKAKK